jgi:hypothetical protein
MGSNRQRNDAFLLCRLRNQHHIGISARDTQSEIAVYIGAIHRSLGDLDPAFLRLNYEDSYPFQIAPISWEFYLFLTKNEATHGPLFAI